ncbi:hypothetical protein BDV98DRAFT_270492 [Pterulicium gracile]|uniref:Uncharacterized protein n=1 Tax=Pterulicium gracile TaxID=1884261 RepID=A0A5C3Q8A5_9AGAR|nr:hypothetical protein BDV98DRAFT_270492 [Pterula gracilis]
MSDVPLISTLNAYDHLLHSGVRPTPQEHESILAARNIYEQERSTSLQEIQRLETGLEQAKEKLGTLGLQIGAHLPLVSPLQRVPPEILRDIFALATPSKPTGIARIADRVLYAPWTTLQVCKQWNEACLMYGSLWSHILLTPQQIASRTVVESPMERAIAEGFHADDPDSPQEVARFVERRTDIVETQLQKTRNTSLSVTIIAMPWPLCGPDYGQPFLRILLPHLHRATYLKAPYHVIVKIHPFHPHLINSEKFISKTSTL